MKIVVVSEFFYPYKTGTQKILTELSEDFVEYGLEVDVLTTKNGCREEKQKLDKYETYKGINIKRIFTTDGDRDSKYKRIISYAVFTWNVFINLLLKKDYDKILFVSNPPLVPYIGYIMKKLKKKEYIYLVHDIYPDVAEKLNVIKENSIISKAMNRINNKVYNNAHKIIALGSDMKQVIVNKGIDKDKIEIVTNWADSKVTYEKNVGSEFFMNSVMENKFNIVYSGNISKVHDVDTLLDVSRQLKDDEEIKFIFVGNGNRRDYIIEAKENESLHNVEVYDYMYGEEYNNLLNSASVFITTLQKGIEGLGVPSKTYTYMSVAKPLIAIMNKDSEIGNMVNKYNLGRQFSSNESKEITEFIYNIKNNKLLYDEICSNVRTVFNSCYERKKVTRKFYNVITK
ncbi:MULTISPECIES: glycosyltransferase family 4 protein [unclassified Clostridium]|uniref:glycosyltransferase family 4 protein n=1 Tax=unclassified Clostridium TaxID=2614128 RepID=UPI0032168C97